MQPGKMKLSDGRRSALVGAPGAETLVDVLRADPHLAPFVAIPARDNGLHVEGLAVGGDRLFVGLRGPVLRGWAVVLELRPAHDPDKAYGFVGVVTSTADLSASVWLWIPEGTRRGGVGCRRTGRN